MDFLAIEASGSLSGFAVETDSGTLAFSESNSLTTEVAETSLFSSEFI